MTESYDLDKFAVQRSFNRASNTYDGMAQLQRNVGLDLLKRFEFSKLNGTVLDLGCGTGFLTHELSQFPMSMPMNRTIFALDIAISMLRLARSKSDMSYICADIEKLPVQSECIDWIFSNLSLQWCSNLDQVFRNFRRILRPDGQFMFSTFGPKTLHELKAAWASVDHFNHVNQFTSDHLLSEIINHAGLQVIALENHQYLSKYLDVFALMRELKGIGAHNVTQGRNKTLSSKGQLRKMTLAYEQLRTDDYLPATFDVIFVYGKVKK